MAVVVVWGGPFTLRARRSRSQVPLFKPIKLSVAMADLARLVKVSAIPAGVAVSQTPVLVGPLALPLLRVGLAVVVAAGMHPMPVLRVGLAVVAAVVVM